MVRFIGCVALLFLFGLGCGSEQPDAEAIPQKEQPDLLTKARTSLESYLQQCNRRISSIESKYTKYPVSLRAGALDIKNTDSALNPYSGVLTVTVTNGLRVYNYQFTLKPGIGDEWEYEICYGGPVSGTSSVWTLRELAYQYEGRVAMEWLLGEAKSKSLLESAL